MTEDELLLDALKAIEALRPALAVLTAYNAVAGAVAQGGVTILYEGLVTIRSELAKGSPEVAREIIAKAGNAALQELAKAHFESMEDTQP